MGNDTLQIWERSDEDLMERYKGGDLDAFEELHRRYAAKVYGFLVRRLGRTGHVDDVFQETFFRLHRYRGRYDSSFPFVPWLFTVTRNVLIDSERKRGVREKRETEIEEALALPQEEAFANEATSELKEELDRLSDREKEVLLLRLEKNLSFNEVATSLGISSSNARQLASRAIRKLRTFWK